MRHANIPVNEVISIYPSSIEESIQSHLKSIQIALPGDLIGVKLTYYAQNYNSGILLTDAPFALIKSDSKSSSFHDELDYKSVLDLHPELAVKFAHLAMQLSCNTETNILVELNSYEYFPSPGDAGVYIYAVFLPGVILIHPELNTDETDYRDELIENMQRSDFFKAIVQKPTNGHAQMNNHTQLKQAVELINGQLFLYDDEGSRVLFEA